MREACGMCGQIFNKEDLDDGICNPCFEEIMHRQAMEEANAPTYHTVTREMAMDAGDPQLEGMTIEW